jgi:hypothetical protein
VTILFFRYAQQRYLKGARRLGYIKHTKNLKVTLWSLCYTQQTYLKGARRLGYFGFFVAPSQHILKVPDDQAS